MTASTMTSSTPDSAREPPAAGQPAPVIHVVDDDPGVLNLFRQMAVLLGMEVRTYEQARQFLDQFIDDRPCCLVLDLNLPDCNGNDVLHQLVQRGSNLPVIVMSGMACVSDAVRSLKLGSLDFVEKPFRVDDMVAALRRAVAADRQRRQDAAGRAELQERLARLTPRERQVMARVVDGLPNKLIAQQLGISAKTIEVHRAAVMRKMRAGSLPELVRMAFAVATG